jgi:uncharacterized protein YkwD
MPALFARFLTVLAISGGLLISTAAAASGAVGLSGSKTLGPATARQALASEGCPAGVSLDAPVVAQQSAMLCLVNETRERWGLPPLTESPLLRNSAIDKGEDLIRCNEFSHTACGREFSYWIHETGYMDSECWRAGENLAWGVDGKGTVSSIFHAWMHSPAHRENILGNFEEVGLELQVDELGGLSGVHLWVQHFGSHCGS